VLALVIVGMAGGMPCCALTCGVGACGVMEGGYALVMVGEMNGREGPVIVLDGIGIWIVMLGLVVDDGCVLGLICIHTGTSPASLPALLPEGNSRLGGIAGGLVSMGCCVSGVLILQAGWMV
jgi:hypothetical protein